MITTDYLRYLHAERRESVSPVAMLGRSGTEFDELKPAVRLADALKNRDSTINEEESFFENSATSPRLYEFSSGKKSGGHSDPINSDTGSAINVRRFAALHGSDEKRGSTNQLGAPSNFLAMLGGNSEKRGDEKGSPPPHKKEYAAKTPTKVASFLDQQRSPQDPVSAGLCSNSSEKLKPQALKKVQSQHGSDPKRGRSRLTAAEAISKWQWDQFSESQASQQHSDAN